MMIKSLHFMQKRRIVLGTVDANRGLFGDRRLKGKKKAKDLVLFEYFIYTVIIADTKPVTVHSQVTTTEAR